MKKLTKLLLLSFFMLIWGVGSTTAQTKKWYEDGGLNSKKVNEWKVASYAKKLATSGDMALVTPFILKKVKDSGTMETLKPYAIELMTCIDEATVDKSYDNMTVAEVAAICAILMEWNKY